ncbi:MAG: aryl-sulfate sulfotransferase [Planctomycetota bacterium]
MAMSAPQVRPGRFAIVLLVLLTASGLLWACGGEGTPGTTDPASEDPPEAAEPADGSDGTHASEDSANGGETDEDAANDAAAPEDAAPAPGAPDDPLRGLVSPAEFERFHDLESRGLVTNAAGASEGWTLVMPLNSTQIHLVDLEGEPQHTWETGLSPGGWAYLQDDGTLFRSARQDEDPRFAGGGIGGILQQIAPDGEVLWQYEFADESRCQHHDIEVLPNGNVLLIAWERISAEEAIAHGRDPWGVGEVGLWADAVYEVKPVLPDGGEIVWHWRVWDHLVQDTDADLPSHGKPADRPERIDVNACFEPPNEVDEEERAAQEQLKKQMAALGYGGGEDDEEAEDDADDAPPPHDWNESGDWLHTNAIDYHPALDLIVLSSPELGEILVIDHSTTTEEAAGSTGGRWGHGGDLLWRWGNPQRYGHGAAADQKLFYQHDPQWLRTPEGLKLSVFNNGGSRPDGSSFSEVLELSLPFDVDEGFARADGEPYGPRTPDWVYADPETFFAAFISGATRLPSGNTLVCSGVVGRIFEVTPDGEVVWDLYSTFGGDVQPPDHAGKAPPYSLYRAARYAPDHPGIVALR